MYYVARYYDPQLGMFVSPDTMIPDPTDFFSYNRYLYSRGNPLSNNDPTGHITERSPSPVMLMEGGGGSGNTIISVLNYCKGDYSCLNYRVNQWLDAHPDYDPASDPYNGQTPDYIEVLRILVYRAVESGDTANAQSYFDVLHQGLAPDIALDTIVSGTQIAAGMMAAFPQLKRILGKYPVSSFRCDKCAQEVYQMFTNAGVDATIYKMNADGDFILLKDGTPLATTGFHEFVVSNDMIYDSVTGPKGMSWSDYEDQFMYGFDGVTIAPK